MHFCCLDAVSYGMTTVKEARLEETCQSFETDTLSRLSPTQPDGDGYTLWSLTFWALFIAAGLASCNEPQELGSTLATHDLPLECFCLSSRKENRACGFDAHSTPQLERASRCLN